MRSYCIKFPQKRAEFNFHAASNALTCVVCTAVCYMSQPRISIFWELEALCVSGKAIHALLCETLDETYYQQEISIEWKCCIPTISLSLNKVVNFIFEPFTFFTITESSSKVAQLCIWHTTLLLTQHHLKNQLYSNSVLPWLLPLPKEPLSDLSNLPSDLKYTHWGTAQNVYISRHTIPDAFPEETFFSTYKC